MKVKNGFTLLELLVVIAVIGVLAAVLMIVINPAEMGRRSRDAKRISDLGTLKSSIDLALADGDTLTDTGGFVEVTSANLALSKLSKYLPVIPKDPGGTNSHVESDCADHTDAAVKRFEFKAQTGVYVVRAQLESKTNCDQIKNDGNSDNYYEMGTAPGLSL